MVASCSGRARFQARGCCLARETVMSSMLYANAGGRRLRTTKGMKCFCGVRTIASLWRWRSAGLVSSVAGSLGRWMSLEADASLMAAGASDLAGALRVGATVWSWICVAGRCVEGRCAVFVCRVLWRIRSRSFGLRGRCCPTVLPYGYVVVAPRASRKKTIGALSLPTDVWCWRSSWCL